MVRRSTVIVIMTAYHRDCTRFSGVLHETILQAINISLRCSKGACLEAAALLIECVTAPNIGAKDSQEISELQGSQDWMEEQYNAPAMEGTVFKLFI